MLSLFITVLHEPQSGPAAQWFRHHWRWQLGYLRDCFITAWKVYDVHGARLPQHPRLLRKTAAKRSASFTQDTRLSGAGVHALNAHANDSREDRLQSHERKRKLHFIHQRSDFSSMLAIGCTLYTMIINMCLNV